MNLITSKDFKFGDKVDIKEKLVRKSESLKKSTHKKWVAVDHIKTNCIFLGFRSISNGVREYDYEEGYSYIPEVRFKVAVVCACANSNSIYVPINSISKVKG